VVFVLNWQKKNGAGPEHPSCFMDWEITYKTELIEGLFVQPDVQYVMNPSFSKTLDPALAATVRFEFNF
jgi:carbohydrate-selective porin OprB